MKEDKKPSNPNAFPNDIHESMNDSEYKHQGMTLRDYFANSAMQGVISTQSPSDFYKEKNQEWIAENSYKLADAMLKQREL